MPVDAALIAPRLGKPGDLRHSVTDRDQKQPTVLSATQASTRDLAQWHVDHAAHSQPVLGRLTVSHGRGSLRALRKDSHCEDLHPLLLVGAEALIERLPRLGELFESGGSLG